MPERLTDIAQRARLNHAASVPAGPVGTPGGRVLTWQGPGPYDFAWQTDPRSPDPKRGRGDPNGVVQGRQGSLYEEITTPPDPPKLWQNQDGLDTWTRAGGGIGTPLVENFVDLTRVSAAAAATVYLPWVPYATGFPANATLLTPGTPGGNAGATVITDGYLTGDLSVGITTGVDAQALVSVQLKRSSTFLEVGFGSLRIAALDTTGPACSIPLNYPCLAGDVIYVLVNPDALAGTTTYGLIANVKQFAA